MQPNGIVDAMLQAVFLAFGQLFDRRILAVFLKSLFVTLLLFAGAGAGLWFGVQELAGRLFGASDQTSSLASLATLILFLLLCWVLFRSIAVAVVQVFGDEVVVAVERRHFPDAVGRDVSFARGLGMGIRSALRTVAVNVVLSPLYLALIVTGVGTPIAFFVVNSWLLGRDLGDTVAARHYRTRAAMEDWRARTGFRRFVLGMMGTALFFIPGINLVASVVGAAMATHFFHLTRRA